MLNLKKLPSSMLALIVAASIGLSSGEELSQGVQIDELKHVECSRPTRNGDSILVNYRGRLQSNGKEFDNSYDRGSPFDFKLGAHQVIQGWDMALLDMCPGEERRLTIPPELAYGDRNMHDIPAGSTLIFDTALVEIIGVKQEVISSSSSAQAPSTKTATTQSTTKAMFSIATAPASSPPKTQDEKLEDTTTMTGSEDGPLKDGEKPKKRCQLLGPFALIVQGALGGFAILTLVIKRYREKPRRPWKIWFFDVSKQVFGSMLTHVLNVGMSMLSSVQLANHAQKFGTDIQAQDEQGHYPNPCSFYLLNLAIDTTLGIPVLYILLMVVTALCLRTPLARPPQSLKSGSYGDPPKTTWYLKQLLIYFVGLTGMKFSVFLLFSALPWLPWIGDWALRWTQFDERLEIAFAMFIFPLMMNAVQYYVIDSLIMDRKRDQQTGYQAVQDHEHRDDEEERLVGDDDATIGEEDERFKLHDEDEDEQPLKVADPTPIGDYSSSSGSTLRGDDDVSRKLK